MATLVDNKKAFFDYEILDTYEAGIELVGLEVKSLKAKHGSLLGAYVLVKGGSAYLMNMLVSPYQVNNTPADYDPRRERRLLLGKEEVRKLADAGKGLTIVPISVYSKGNLVKVSVAVVRGKKKYDKRETIKSREADREMGRAMRDR